MSSTIGSINIEILADNQVLTHTFHVVNTKLNIKTDGLLGRDFLMKYLCKIDFETLTLQIYHNEDYLTLPIYTSSDKSKNSCLHIRHAQEERFEDLKQKLNIGTVETNSKTTIQHMCNKYNQIFHMDGDALSINNFYEQDISTTNDTPVYIRNYRIPKIQQDEMDRQVADLLQNDIIEPSTSPYNSPILLVPKKKNSKTNWRLVVDFRALNKKIVGDKFPVTRIEDVLDKLSNAKFFSTLDMTSSFHQIPLKRKCRPLTAFSTISGHYQFKRLPFGLKISTNSFQRMLTLALTGLQNAAFIYVDDIIIFGSDIETHNKNLELVMQRLQKYNLKLNPDKCSFLKTEVVYLGHLITDQGIKTDPAKFDTIQNYPVPKDADETRRFVAFCNYYRRFIENFAAIARPLNALLAKSKIFNWDEKCSAAFEQLKNKLMSPPVLRYPDFNQKFIVTTDASAYALGAILSQGEIGTDRPIAYASRTLNKYELNKPPIEQELLGIYFAIKYFRPYLFGKKFTIVTDHSPLVSLFKHKDPSSKLTRIRLELMEYDFDIIYKQGKMNTNADALSRIKLDSDKLKEMIPKEINVLTRKMQKDANPQQKEQLATPNYEPRNLHIWDAVSLSDINNMWKLKFIIVNKILQGIKITDDPSRKTIYVEFSNNPPEDIKLILGKLCTYTSNSKISYLALEKNSGIFDTYELNQFKGIFNKLQNGKQTNLKIILYNPPLRIVCQERQIELIKTFHDTQLCGHLGIKKCLNKLKQKYLWKNMHKMVKAYVNNCQDCATSKITKHTKEILTKTDTPKSSFETISIDTVGPLRPSCNFRYILTAQCDLTKFIIAIPLENKNAVTVAKAIVEEIILKYGCFKCLKTDKGTEFTNELLTNICKLLQIKKTSISAISPRNIRLN